MTRARKLAIIGFIIFALTSCAVEDTALNATPRTPRRGTYAISETRTKSTSNKNATPTPVSVRFTLSKNHDNEYNARIDELLGAQTNATVNIDTAGIHITQIADAQFSWQFDQPVDLAKFPMHVEDHRDIHSLAKTSFQGHLYQYAVSGSISIDRAKLVPIANHAIRVFVETVNLRMSFSDASAGTSGEVTHQKLREITGEIWFAPSYGLPIGSNLHETFLGDVATDRYDETLTWQLANLDPK